MIASRVLEAAFIYAASVAQQQRTWREHLGPVRRTILKASGHHRGDGYQVVPVLEWSRFWIARIGDIDDAPTRSTGEHLATHARYSTACRQR
jgi:hypothetical protein